MTKIRSRRNKRTYKGPYKGGKVLGIGADGCVFSEAAWPCATPLPGYDPSDPTVVSKLIAASDNEDEIINLALSIVPPEDKKHLIGFIGTCAPATKSIARSMANAKTIKELADNQKEIFDLYKKHYAQDENDRGHPNSCVRIAAWQAEGTNNSIRTQTNEYDQTYEDVKVIVNKKYQNTLRKYLEDHVADKSFAPLLKACVKYVEVLETLAEGVDGKRLVNVDLHSANIFVNKEPSGELIVGIADFGRCAIQKGTDTAQREKMATFLINYYEHYNVTFGFPVVPFELKLYSFIKSPRIRYINNVDEILRKFAHALAIEETKRYTTPFSLFTEDEIASILLKYFKRFTSMVQSYRYKDPREGVEFIRLCLLNRFNSLGFLQVLINELVYVDEYRSYTRILGPIKNKIMNNILHNIAFGPPANDLEKLYKLYFDTLLEPHREITFSSLMTTPSSYIGSLLRGGPHAFSERMAAALGFRAASPVATTAAAPAIAATTAVPPLVLGRPPLHATTRPAATRAVNPRITAAAAVAAPQPTVAPPPTVATQAPAYLTRAALKKNPALATQLYKPYNAAAARNASRKATLNIIKSSRGGKTRKQRKQRH